MSPPRGRSVGRPATLLLLAAALAPAARGADPTPPRQNDPWEPPATALPRFVVPAVAALFEQGLADPRGCEYRSVRIALGTLWTGQPHEVITSGWVLPAAEGEARRHAVTWSGLVHPLNSVGAPADLDADIRSLVRGDARPGGNGPDEIFLRSTFGRGGYNGAFAVAVPARLPIKVALLLRLGRVDLAEAAWEAITGRPIARGPRGEGPTLDLTFYGVSYLTLASDLAWVRFDRAVDAHMQGEDALALADARDLFAFERGVDARAEAMGFEWSQRSRRFGRSRFLDFLDQIPDLLADQERRAREHADLPAAPQDERREDRIAALIRDLDQIAVRQLSVPGTVNPAGSPTFQALLAEGNAAVIPLIDVLRFDDRLTRSVPLSRGGQRGRWILPVDHVAFLALKQILKITPKDPFEPGDGARRRQAAADEFLAAYRKATIRPTEP